jgi:LemA protein
MNMASGVAVVVGAILLVVSIRLYNRFVSQRLAVDNAFATIDVQLKVRCDLVPNVVEAVRGYMQYERGVLEQLTSLRSQATAGNLDAAARLNIDGRMSGLLGRVFAAVEQYPALKAAESVLMLQRTLNEVEAQIAAARRTYNASVTEYNFQIASFPASIVAVLLGFRPRPLFEAVATDREPVPVTPLGGR